MDAKEKISVALQASVFTIKQAEDLAQELHDAVARELVAKQRAKLIADGYGPLDEDDDGICPCGGCSWCLAQDYIDIADPDFTP